MKMTFRQRLSTIHTHSRRRFLTAMGAITATVGLAPACTREAPTKPWDLIVVGGGNAGLPAAIFASKRGARVLIIEAAGVLGGTLFLSSGQMSAAGTKLQKAKGIVGDTPQAHYDDVMRISKGTADPDIVRLAVFNAADTFDWLTDNGFEVRPGHPVTGTTHEPYSHARYAWGPKGGMSILKVLEEQLEPEIERGNVTVMLGTEVTELIQDESGAVTGVVSSNAGETQRHLASNVLLSCGGYASNSEMFERLEGAKDYADVSYPYSQGAGITLGLGAGGYVRGGEHHLPLFGGIMADDNYPSRMIANVRHFPPDRPPWEILVNVHGERFLREDIPSHDAYEHALMAQPEERCWVVFDDAIFKQAPTLVQGGFGGPMSEEDVREAFEQPWPMFYRADSLEGLAEACRVDATGLARTVASYNQGQASGDDELGRQYMPRPIEQAPFFAIQVQSWLLTGYAGLGVDAGLRVVREDQTPIPNLYAAGELLGTGQTMGRSYCGGMLVTPSLTFGRLLGQEIIPFDT